MARSRVYRLGPGRLEGCELRVWARPRTDGRVIVAELRGYLIVYCGNGSVHYPDVVERLEATRGDYRRTVERYGADIASTSTSALLDRLFLDRSAGDDEDHIATAYALAQELEMYALEAWRDPCEDECAECSAPAEFFDDSEFGRYCAEHAPAELLEELASQDASLGVGHVWTNVACPAYRTYRPTDCVCTR